MGGEWRQKLEHNGKTLREGVRRGNQSDGMSGTTLKI